MNSLGLVMLLALTHVQTLERHPRLVHSFVTLNWLSMCHTAVTLPV
jgi:hypothetical protein